MDIISREEAKKKGYKFYFTGVPCRKGHSDYRYVAGNSCRTCRSNRHKGVLEPDVEVHPRSDAVKNGDTTYYTGILCKEGHDSPRYTKNGSCVKCREIYHQERMEDPLIYHSKLEYNKRHYKENREEKSEYAKNYKKKIKQENGETYHNYLWRKRAHESKRRFLKRASSHPVFNELVDSFYEQAKMIEDKLQSCVVSDDPYDLKVNVDHIIPICGKDICGLHAPQNLEIIPARDNFKKQATFEPYTERHT